MTRDEFSALAEQAIDRINGASLRVQEKMAALAGSTSIDPAQLMLDYCAKLDLEREAADLKLRAEYVLKCADLAQKCPDTMDDMAKKIEFFGNARRRHLQ